MTEAVLEGRAQNPSAEAKALAQEAYALARERAAAGVCQKLMRAARPVTDRAEVVAVGIRSVGKSSLLNAVIGREVLPTHLDVSSNVYVRVGWGPVPPAVEDPGERVTVVFADGREPLEVDLAELPTWASEQGNPYNRHGVSQVRVRLEAPVIVDGLTLTDTPGEGGLIAAHAEAIRAACQVADGLLVVLDHVQPISQSVLDFLVSLGGIRRAVFAFNKVDTDGATERSIADTRELLASAGTTRLAEAPMIATSAYLAEEAIAEGTDGKPDPELWREAGIDELVGALRSAILEPEQREQARALLAEIGDALRLLAAPDLARLRAAEQDERPRTEALAELKRLHALNVRSDLNSRLTTEYPRFPVLLKKELLSAFNRLEDHIQSGASNLRETVPGETTKEVNGAWGATMRPLRSFITAKAAEVGLNIEVELPAIGLPGAQPDPELPPDPNLTGKGSRFISRLWKAVMKVIIDPIAGPPLALAELGFDTKAAREIRDRGTAITYIRRERDRMLVLLPEELRSNYLSLFERAAADLEATRAERIGALEQVEAAVASPPTPEELERSRERMAELRALDERVRAAAGRV